MMREQEIDWRAWGEFISRVALFRNTAQLNNDIRAKVRTQ